MDADLARALLVWLALGILSPCRIRRLVTLGLLRNRSARCSLLMLMHCRLDLAILGTLRRTLMDGLVRGELGAYCDGSSVEGYRLLAVD